MSVWESILDFLFLTQTKVGVVVAPSGRAATGVTALAAHRTHRGADERHDPQESKREQQGRQGQAMSGRG